VAGDKRALIETDLVHGNLDHKYNMIYNEFDGITSWIPFDHTDFFECVNLWSSTDPYSKLHCETIQWRLIPAFENKKIMMFRKGINIIGFFTWGWMTENEFDEFDFDGEQVFSRETSDKCVIIDVIVKEDLVKCIKHMKVFGKQYHPHIDMIYFHREKYNYRPGRAKTKLKEINA